MVYSLGLIIWFKNFSQEPSWEFTRKLWKTNITRCCFHTGCLTLAMHSLSLMYPHHGRTKMNSSTTWLWWMGLDGQNTKASRASCKAQEETIESEWTWLQLLCWHPCFGNGPGSSWPKSAGSARSRPRSLPSHPWPSRREVWGQNQTTSNSSPWICLKASGKNKNSIKTSSFQTQT